MNVREVFWSMVRDPELLIDYVRSLGLDINELCGAEPLRGLRCPPSVGDDFRVRFFVTSYIYLWVLRYELGLLGSSSVVVEGVGELVGDVITDLRLYGAPEGLLSAVVSIARELLKLSPPRA